MIEELIAVLTTAGLEAEPRELRDALWLAGHIVIAERTDGAGRPPRKPAAAPQPALPSPDAEASTPGGEPPAPAEVTTGAELYAAGSGGGELLAMEARSPAVPALRRQLQLARALRPFKRRVPSRTSFMVDEAATAARVAEEGIWLPVLRPTPARWLDLTLVFDTSPSMVVWRRTMAEFRTLAERLGAFRAVRVFAVDSSADPSKPLTIRPEPLTGGRTGLSQEPTTLIDPTRRQVTLVVTDAVSDAWRDGRMDTLLRRWGAAAPLAVATVLPQRMWAGTGLRAVPAQLHAPSPGLANGTLGSRARGTRTAIGGVPIPVMELSARWLAQWAQLVAGTPNWRNAALLETPPAVAAPAPGLLADGSATEIVRAFRAAASPTAFQLACYLSAAWLNLPVMRLVQRVMLPQSDTTHLAEVFLGGLLRAVPAEDGADPEAAQYDFLPEVRDELTTYLLRDEMLDVLRETSVFVAEHFGQPLDFAALLADPEGAPLPTPAGGGPPLAHIAATALAKLGGRYRALADRLATAGDPYPTGAAQAIRSLQHLSTTDLTGRARYLLDLLSVLSPSGVSVSILASSLVGDTPAAPLDEAAIGQLESLSLAQRSADGKSLHVNLSVQQVVREALQANARFHDVVTAAITLLNDVVENTNNLLVAFREADFEEMTTSRRPADARDRWSRETTEFLGIAEIAEHVETLWEHVLAHQDSFADEAAVSAMLAVRAQTVLALLDSLNIGEAIDMGDTVLADCEGRLGESHETTLLARKNLAQAHIADEGDAGGEGLWLLQENVRITRAVFGAEHPLTAAASQELLDAEQHFHM